ncbi:MAG: hypothetical protein HN348_18765 [Proteobacteria bacterium]|jgi:hypothetical protein|nr:hypothetical protein [Pseudomonadota bacterium]
MSLALIWLLLGSASAEEVAAVMLINGDVSVTSAGMTKKAFVGLGLDLNDVVTTDWDSAVVLHLSNDHLVRVDEDLELTVGDLVLLDAPQAKQDVKTQLETLLYPEDRVAMKGLEQAERVAGWHARITASVAPATTEQDTIRRGGPAAGRSPAVSAAAMVREEPAEPDAFEAPPGMVTRSASAKPAGMTKEQLEAMFAPQGTLYQCLVDWTRTLPIAMEAYVIVVKMREGQVATVRVKGGLSVPLCAREVVGRAYGGGEEEVEITLEL